MRYHSKAMEKCKHCNCRGTVLDDKEVRVLCLDCNVLCPQCDGRGWSYSGEDRDGCDLCEGEGLMNYFWAKRHQDALGPYVLLRDIDGDVALDRMNRRMRTKMEVRNG